MSYYNFYHSLQIYRYSKFTLHLDFVIFILESNVYLLKKTYVSSRGGDHVHTSETISLNHTSNQIVGKMELYKNNDKVNLSTHYDFEL